VTQGLQHFSVIGRSFELHKDWSASMATQIIPMAAAIFAGLALVSAPTRSFGHRLGASIEAWRTRARGMLHPYRPELHYMRGPGPKWREKHLGPGRGQDPIIG
jgi:hypothetical protein